MYLARLRARRLKLLEDFTLGFLNADGTPRLWTVIIGRNGTAKSSLLQAIALSAAGKLQINGLARGALPHLRDRRAEEALEIEADFCFQGKSSEEAAHPLLKRALGAGERVRSVVRMEASSQTLASKAFYCSGEGEPLTMKGEVKELMGADPLVQARDTAQNPAWFVAGYGISRFLPDPSKAPLLNQPSIERLEALFSSTMGLTSLRFVDFFEPSLARTFVKALRDTLVRVQELVPDLEDIELRGKGGVSKAGQLIDRDRFALKIGQSRAMLPAVALSHGYQSTIAWIADLIGHILLEHGGKTPIQKMQGLVLIDEIDLYLHPSWQASLITALREVFPRLQFVATTHSPVVLSALEAHEIVRLETDPETGSVYRAAVDPETGAAKLLRGQEEAVAQEPDPRTLTGTELYRRWFGLDRLVLNPHGELLRTWRRIASDPFRTDEEEAQLVTLREALEAANLTPPLAPVLRERP